MKQTRAGLGFGISAYLIWGAFPMYFGLISMVNPLEVVPWRVSATLAFCLLVVTISRRWTLVSGVLKKPRTFGWLVLSGLLLYANWQLFVVGVITGHVLEVALGYFINPLFTVVLGVVFLKEQLSRLQWIAVAIAAVSVVAAAIAYGAFPWISLGLAFTFGMYGLLRKRAGNNIDGITGLTVETLASVPVAIVQLILVGSIVGLTGFSFGPGITVLILLSGVLTAIPLILFGEAARRLPLSYLGFIQFLTPILGFIYGYFVMHEEMSAGRWFGFIGVWCALVILVVDMWRRTRRSPAAQVNTGLVTLDPLD